MASKLLVKQTVITVKVEATYNVDSIPANTDAILVEEPTPPSSEGLRMIERPAVSSNISPKQKVYGGRLAGVSFNVEIKGSGAAGTAPEIDALLRACGFASTVVPAVSVTYNPASNNQESCTIYYYLSGKLTKLTGCRGTVTFQFETGGKAMASFNMIGHVTNPTDTAIVTPAYDNTIPSALINVPFSVGGYSAVINSLNFDMGTELSTPPDMSAVDGYGEVSITAYAPTGTFDPENTLVADQDWYADFVAGNTKVLTTGIIGTTAGNRFQFDHPAIAYTDISHGDRDGLATLEIPYDAIDSAGDDFVSLAFT